MNTTVCPVAQEAGFGEKDSAPFTPVIVTVTTFADVGGVVCVVGVVGALYPPPPPPQLERSIAARTYPILRGTDIESSGGEPPVHLQRQCLRISLGKTAKIRM
jgi:hypothetical protein